MLSINGVKLGITQDFEKILHINWKAGVSLTKNLVDKVQIKIASIANAKIMEVNIRNSTGNIAVFTLQWADHEYFIFFA